MKRRNFLIGGIAASAAVRTWPFRVYSFPSNIILRQPRPFLYAADDDLIWPWLGLDNAPVDFADYLNHDTSLPQVTAIVYGKPIYALRSDSPEHARVTLLDAIANAIALRQP